MMMFMCIFIYMCRSMCILVGDGGAELQVPKGNSGVPLPALAHRSVVTRTPRPTMGLKVEIAQARWRQSDTACIINDSH